jgi:small subunit ribosomal protein S9
MIITSTKKETNNMAAKLVKAKSKKQVITTKKKSTSSTKMSYTYALGRRKTATARVRLYKKSTVPGVDGKHQLVVNGKPAEVYFPGDHMKQTYRNPFVITQTLQNLSASIKVEGSGVNGQLGATVHGLARALAIFKPEFRADLKSAGLLTRDPRARERRKAGKGGKARRSKQSPKR